MIFHSLVRPNDGMLRASCDLCELFLRVDHVTPSFFLSSPSFLGFDHTSDHPLDLLLTRLNLDTRR